MKLKTKLFLLSLFTMGAFTNQAAATDFSCPETHSAHKEILNELQTFQKQLVEEFKCQEYAGEISKLSESLNSETWKEIFSLVKNNEGGSLSAESAEKVQAYVGGVTKNIAGLIGSISSVTHGDIKWWEAIIGTDKCNMDREEQFDGIEKLTIAANEVTNLIAKVAGPYGVPLQVGVSTIYGVVQGLKDYSEASRNVDFDNFEKRQFFESAVCVMSKFDSDVRKLNNPQGYLKKLELARLQAQRVVNAVSFQCVDCEPSEISPDKTAKKVEGQQNLAWVESEISKFKEIKDLRYGGVGPAQLQFLNNQIHTFLYRTVAPDFLDWYVEAASITNAQFNRGAGETLKEMRAEIESAGYKFDITLPVGRSAKREKKTDFLTDLTTYNHRSGALYIVAHAPEIPKMYHIMKNRGALDQYSDLYYSLLGKSYDKWKQLDLELKVVEEYCSFVELRKLTNTSLNNVCRKGDYVWQSLRAGYQAFYLASLINTERELDVLGPFDFRLESHYAFIAENRRPKSVLLQIAESGLDMESILAEDRGVRQKDGRLDPVGEDYPGDVSWWMNTKNHADDFLKAFENLR